MLLIDALHALTPKAAKLGGFTWFA